MTKEEIGYRKTSIFHKLNRKMVIHLKSLNNELIDVLMHSFSYYDEIDGITHDSSGVEVFNGSSSKVSPSNGLASASNDYDFMDNNSAVQMLNIYSCLGFDGSPDMKTIRDMINGGDNDLIIMAANMLYKLKIKKNEKRYK